MRHDEQFTEASLYTWREECRLEVLLAWLLKWPVTDSAQFVHVARELHRASCYRLERLERRLSAKAIKFYLFRLPAPCSEIDEVIEAVQFHIGNVKDNYMANAMLARTIQDPESAFAMELNRISSDECLTLSDRLLEALYPTHALFESPAAGAAKTA